MTMRRLTSLLLALAVVALATLLPGGPPPAHAQTGETTLWTGTLVAGAGTFSGTDATGYCTGAECSPGTFGSLSPVTFTHTFVPYTVQKILVTASLGSLQLDQRLDLNVATPLNLYVGTTAYPLAYAGSTGNLHLTGIPVLTNGQAYTVSIRTTTAPPPPPPETVENQLWTATMTVGEATFPGATTKGFITPELGGGLGAISPQSFTYGGATRLVRQLYHHLPGGQCCQLRFEVDFEITSGSFVLRVGADEHRFTAADGTGSPNSLFQFTTSNLNWTNGQMVTVSLAEIVPPPETNEITLWSATLVAGTGTLEGENAVGYCALASCLPRVYGTLSPDSFDYYGTTYTVRVIANDELDILASTTTLLHEASPFSLYVGDTEYTTTYTSASADINYDLSGNISLTAGQSYTVSIRTTAPPPPPPPETNEITLWTATLTAASGTHEGDNTAGYCASNLCNPNPFGSLTTTTFTHGGGQYGVRWILSGEDIFITGEPRLSGITLYLDSDSYPLTYNSGTQGYDATGSIALTAGQTYTASIRIPPPPPPPGTLWSATLVAGAGPLEAVAATGYCTGGRCNEGNFGSLNPATFTYKGVQYAISKLLVQGSGRGILTLSPRLDLVTSFSLYVGDTEYPATFGSGGEEYDLTGTPALTDGQTYTVSIRTPPPPPLPEGTLWSATLVAGAGTLEGVNATGYCALASVNGVSQCVPQIFGTLSPDSFDYDGTTYTVNLIANDELYITADLHEATPFSLYVGDTRYTTTFTSPDADINYRLSRSIPLTAGQTYTVSIRTPPVHKTTLWAATLTAGAGSIEAVATTGYCALPRNTCGTSHFGTLSPNSFTYDGTTYIVNLIVDGQLDISRTGTPLHDVAPFSLFVGDTEYPATYNGVAADINYALSGDLSMVNGRPYTVSIRAPVPPAVTTLWSTTMTVGSGSGYTGYFSGAGSVSSSNEFVFNGNTYKVGVLAYGGGSDRLELVLLRGGSRSGLGAGMFRLTLGSRMFEFDGSTGYNGASKAYTFTEHGLSWSGGQQVAVSLDHIALPPPPPPPPPPGTFWTGSLMAGAGVYSSAAGGGFCDLPACVPSPFGSLTPTQFNYNGVTHTVRAFMSGGAAGGGGSLFLSGTGAQLQNQTPFIVYVGETAYGVGAPTARRYPFGGAFPTLVAGQTYQVSLARKVDYDAADDNRIEISNLAQLNAVRWDLDANSTVISADTGKYTAAFPAAMTNMGCATTCDGYELVADLDFDTNNDGRTDIAGDTYWNGGAGWNPIGQGSSSVRLPFQGEFHGNGHTISNLYINRNNADQTRIGLFAHIGHPTANSVWPALVRHVGLINPYVKNSVPNGQILAGDVGGLVGWVQPGASVVASYVQGGTVSGGNYVGGLVGSNSGTVLASWSSATIPSFLSGSRDVAQSGGGLVGINQGTINASYAAGCVLTAITSTEGGNRGGLVGTSSGTITNSYFDKSTCPNPLKNDVAARGKTTAELQNVTGYGGIYGGWNVNVDGVVGNDWPWDFGTTTEYPALKADRNNDGTSTWQEFGLQGRVDRPDVTITAVRPAVTEGEDAEFTVSIESAPVSNLVVNLQRVVKGNCATVSCDEPVPGSTGVTVTIMAGQTSAAHSVPTANDEADEYDGAVTLTVLTGAGLYDVGSPDAATVTVTDDEPPPSFEFQEADGRSTETYGRIPVNVEMTPNVQYKSGVSVNWATTADAPPNDNVRAMDGVDFTTSSGTLAFPPNLPGQDALRYRSFNFTLVNDDIDESDEENVYIALSIPPGVDATIGNRSRMLLRITDDDRAQPQLAPAVAAEGSGALRATWAVPPNTAADAFSGYNVQYRLAAGVMDDDTPAWTDGPQDVLALTAVIDGLDANTEYQARVAPVRLKSAARVWSAIGAGTTGALPPGVPGPPGTPTFTAPTTDGWTAAWTAPADRGDSPLTGYDLRYRLAGSGVLFTDGPQGLTIRAATVTGLEPNTAYEAQARAVNTQGGGAWSASGYVATTVDGAIFSGTLIVGTQTTSGVTGRGYAIFVYGSLTPFVFNDGARGRSFVSLVDAEPANQLYVDFDKLPAPASLPGSFILRLDNASFLLDSASYGSDSSQPTAYPESTEGGRRVSVLKRQEGVPVNLG